MTLREINHASVLCPQADLSTTEIRDLYALDIDELRNPSDAYLIQHSYEETAFGYLNTM